MGGWGGGFAAECVDGGMRGGVGVCCSFFFLSGALVRVEEGGRALHETASPCFLLVDTYSRWLVLRVAVRYVW